VFVCLWVCVSVVSWEASDRGFHRLVFLQSSREKHASSYRHVTDKWRRGNVWSLQICSLSLSLSLFFFRSPSSTPSPQCLTLKWHRNQTISRREIKVLLCPLALVNMATMFENVASLSNLWFWNKSSLFPLVDAQNDVIYYYYFGLICSIILENNVILWSRAHLIYLKVLW